MSTSAVYKSTAAEFLDELFGGTAEELGVAYERALGLLESIGDGPLSEAAAMLVGDDGLPPEAVEDSATGWRAGDDVDRVLRAGYRQAIQLASSGHEPVPIETLWLTGASDSFEVHICEGRHQVTVVLMVPLVRSYGSRRAQARSWVVRSDAGDDEAAHLPEEGDPPVVMVQTSGIDADEPVARLLGTKAKRRLIPPL